jgi:hypothetical protein
VLDGSVKNVSLNKGQDVEASGTEHVVQISEDCLNTSCGNGRQRVTSEWSLYDDLCRALCQRALSVGGVRLKRNWDSLVCSLQQNQANHNFVAQQLSVAVAEGRTGRRFL